MKKKFLSMTSLILMSATLVACSVNSSKEYEAPQDVKDAAQHRQDNWNSVGFIDYFSKAKNSIWFQIHDTIPSKNVEIEAVNVFDKGKVTRYLLKKIETNSDGDEEYSNYTLKDLKGMSDEEILKLAQKSEKEYFDARKANKLRIFDKHIKESKEAIANGQAQAEYTDESSLATFEKGKKFYTDLDYKEFRKYNTDIELKAEVETGNSGNYVVEENITNLDFVDMLDGYVDFEWHPKDGEKESTDISTELISMTMDESHAIPVYDDFWIKFRIREKKSFINRKLTKENLLFQFDELDTKNVKEVD